MHPISTAHQYTLAISLSMHFIKPLYQHAQSTHFINTLYQYALSRRIISTALQYALSIHPLTHSSHTHDRTFSLHPFPHNTTAQRMKTRSTAKSGLTLYMTDIFIRPHNSDRCNLVTHISSMDVNNEEAMVSRVVIYLIIPHVHTLSHHILLYHILSCQLLISPPWILITKKLW